MSNKLQTSATALAMSLAAMTGVAKAQPQAQAQDQNQQQAQAQSLNSQIANAVSSTNNNSNALASSSNSDVTNSGNSNVDVKAAGGAGGTGIGGNQSQAQSDQSIHTQTTTNTVNPNATATGNNNGSSSIKIDAPDLVGAAAVSSAAQLLAIPLAAAMPGGRVMSVECKATPNGTAYVRALQDHKGFGITGKRTVEASAAGYATKQDAAIFGDDNAPMTGAKKLAVSCAVDMPAPPPVTIPVAMAPARPDVGFSMTAPKPPAVTK